MPVWLWNTGVLLVAFLVIAYILVCTYDVLIGGKKTGECILLIQEALPLGEWVEFKLLAEGLKEAGYRQDYCRVALIALYERGQLQVRVREGLSEEELKSAKLFGESFIQKVVTVHLHDLCLISRGGGKRGKKYRASKERNAAWDWVPAPA